MNRREFVVLLGASGAAWPLAARAQQPTKVPRIGFLRFGPASANAGRVEALRAGLRQLGYVEGKNITIEFRFAERIEVLRELADDLARADVDIIFATGSTELEAARQATKTIPIVFATHADPVGAGHIASLARPGENITGLSMLLTELVAKELEILKEAVPQATRIGVLFSPWRLPTVLPCWRWRPPAKGLGSSSSWFLCEPSRTSRGVLNNVARTCRRFSRRDGADLFFAPHAPRRPRIEAPAAGDVRGQGVFGGGRSH